MRMCTGWITAFFVRWWMMRHKHTICRRHRWNRVSLRLRHIRLYMVSYTTSFRILRWIICRIRIHRLLIIPPRVPNTKRLHIIGSMPMQRLINIPPRKMMIFSIRIPSATRHRSVLMPLHIIGRISMQRLINIPTHKSMLFPIRIPSAARHRLVMI